MSDILDVTKAQARVLRSIAYFESDSGIKGATQYTCSRKVPNGLHVSGSTFNDNIKDLEKNLMVFRLKGKKGGNKETKPYTITDIGQVAWLRYFTLPENMEIIQKIFPNIQLSDVDDIINKIQHPLTRKIKNNYSIRILGIALNSFHVEDLDVVSTDYFKPMTRETIYISGYFNLVKTSFSRDYDITHPLLNRSLEKRPKGMPNYIKNFYELEISVIDRITFLFYYNLIQSLLDSAYAMNVILIILKENESNNIEKIMTDKEIFKENLKINKEKLGRIHHNLMLLSFEIPKKKKEIMKIISSNEAITKIIQDNLKNLNEYKSNDDDFQNISQIFLKS